MTGILKYFSYSFLFALFIISDFTFAQNVGINTTGATPASTNMLEVLQPSTTDNSVGIYVNHSGATAGSSYALQAIKNGASLTNVAAYLSSNGGTNNYALLIPTGIVSQTHSFSAGATDRTNFLVDFNINGASAQSQTARAMHVKATLGGTATHTGLILDMLSGPPYSWDDNPFAAGYFETDHASSGASTGDIFSTLSISKITDGSIDILTGAVGASKADGGTINDEMYGLEGISFMNGGTVNKAIGVHAMVIQNPTTPFGCVDAIGLDIEVASANSLNKPYSIRTDEGIAAFNYNKDLDADFKISGNTEDNLFYLDASANGIGIGTLLPSYILDVNGYAAADNLITTIPLWQAGSAYAMSNTSGADLSNCESALDPALYNSLGNIEVRLIIRITSETGVSHFQLRTHDGTTEIYPIVSGDAWTYASTQSGKVAISPWKDFAAGTNAREIHLHGWVDFGTTSFNSAYLQVRPNR